MTSVDAPPVVELSSTEDSQAIQRAIDDASMRGVLILLAPGTYHIAETLRVPATPPRDQGD